MLVFLGLLFVVYLFVSCPLWWVCFWVGVGCVRFGLGVVACWFRLFCILVVVYIFVFWLFDLIVISGNLVDFVLVGVRLSAVCVLILVVWLLGFVLVWLVLLFVYCVLLNFVV